MKIEAKLGDYSYDGEVEVHLAPLHKRVWLDREIAAAFVEEINRLNARDAKLAELEQGRPPIGAK